MKKTVFFLVMLATITNSAFSQDSSPKGKFSGYAFGDYFYNISSPTSGLSDLNGIQFRRIYLTYDYAISETFSSRFRLEADQTANSSDGKVGTFVKDAYLQWKNIFDGSDLVFGIQPTPGSEVAESVWGNRFLEKTIMDLRGIVSSRDMGIALKGKLTDDGMFKYWLLFGNGSGNKPETDKYKRYYAQMQFSPIENITLSGYGDFKAKKSILDLSDSSGTVSNNDLTGALLAGYAEKGVFSLGAEGVFVISQNSIKKSAKELADKNGLGFSVYGTFTLTEAYGLIGRYDYFDPNTDSNAKGDLKNLFIGGLTYKPDPKVTISPNLIYETTEKTPGKSEPDPAITARLTVFYNF